MWIVSYCGTYNNLGIGNQSINLFCQVRRSGRKRNGQREGKLTERLSLVRMQPLACKKKRFLCNHISHVPVTLTLTTPWVRAHLDIIVCKFGRNRSICVVVEAICAKSLQTDRQADRQTDDVRRAIVLWAKMDFCLSLWKLVSHGAMLACPGMSENILHVKCVRAYFHYGCALRCDAWRDYRSPRNATQRNATRSRNGNRT